MKNVTTYRLRTEPSGAYRRKILSLSTRRPVSVDEVIDSCVDNILGFGDPDFVRAQMVQLKELGHETYFDDVLCQELSVKFEWLLYRPSDVKRELGLEMDRPNEWLPCSPELSVGANFDIMERSIKLVRKIGRAIARSKDRSGPIMHWVFEDPEDVLAAIGNMRSTTRVQRVEISGIGYFVPFREDEAKEEAA